MNEKLNKAFLKLLLLGLCFTASAVYPEVKPLFYKTINFAVDDTLNIREKPDYQSIKIGEIALGMQLSVEECIQKKQSKWCKIKPLYGEQTSGWVNEKYIIPITYQEGYVTIKGKKSICDYVLSCEKRDSKAQCLVVTGLTDNKKIAIETEWVDYQRLKPASNFSAADDADLNPEGGFCTRGKYVNEYFKNKRIRELSQKFTSPEFLTVLALLRALNDQDETAIEALIHPKSGVRLSALSYFDRKGSQWLLQKDFLNNYKSRIKLDWGQTEAKGDSIKKNLYAYFEDLPKDIPHIGKVIRQADLKNFPQQKGQKLEAFEIYWYLDENNKEYAYTGLVIVLEAYKDKWNVVGISKDYWTP